MSTTKNRNTYVQLAKQHNVHFDSRILQPREPVRGIYGIFVDDECQYVGRSYSIYRRFFCGSQCHIYKMEKGKHVSKVVEAWNNKKDMYVKVLEEVHKIDDHPAKDAQRLASAECKWIDYYQALNQCLEQYPEGHWKVG